MLSLSRAPGEAVVLIVDPSRDPALVRLVERLGGSAKDLEGLATRVLVQYTGQGTTLRDVRFKEPEAFLGISAPRHVRVWRHEHAPAG